MTSLHASIKVRKLYISNSSPNFHQILILLRDAEFVEVTVNRYFTVNDSIVHTPKRADKVSHVTILHRTTIEDTSIKLANSKSFPCHCKKHSNRMIIIHPLRSEHYVLNADDQV